MKLTKKIIVAVLALALLASSIVSSVFANDTVNGTFSAEGINGIDDILEYYTCDAYVAENYEDEEDKVYADLSAYTGISASGNPMLQEKYFELYDCMNYFGFYNHMTSVGVEANPNDATDKVLALNLGVDDWAAYSYASPDKKALTDKVFFTFDVYFDESCMSNAFFEVEVVLEGKSPVSVLKFDFGQGDMFYSYPYTEPVVWYATWNEATGGFSNTSQVIDNFTPKFNTWYSVEVCFNSDDDNYSLKIFEGENTEPAANVAFQTPGANGISEFKCKSAFYRVGASFFMVDEDPANPLHALMYLDDMNIYEGSFLRNPANRDEIAEITLKELAALFNSADCTAEDRLLIADVYYELLNFDANSRAMVEKLVPTVWENVNLTYANEIINRVSKINGEGTYYERQDYVTNKIAPYDSRITAGVVTELPGVSADVIAALNEARVAFQAELAALDVIRMQSEGFINALKAYDPANRDYSVIVSIYLEASKDEYKARMSDYEGMAEAELIFAELTAKYERMTSDVDDFVKLVNNMKAATTFGAYYDAFKIVKLAYYKYDEMPEFALGAFINPDLDSSTCPPLAEAMKYFEDNEADAENMAALCDAFNNEVFKASATEFYPALGTILNSAEAAYAAISGQFDYVKDYKGIEEGLTLADTYAAFEALKESYNAMGTASAAYINAVRAINGAIGFYAKRDAVNKALSLKAAGDNLDVEGVLEANLDLAKAEAMINELQGNSESLLALVAALEEAETISERRALIQEAGLYVDGATTEYHGVKTAITTLEKETEALEKDIAAVNEALMNAVKNAVAF